LRAALRGPVLLPGMPGYEEARHIFNGMIDRHPAAIVQPLDTEEVRQVVATAVRDRCLVSIRGGGHSAPGHAVCDNGLMIDLSRVKSIVVDPVARTARAGGGVTWGEFDAATQAHGLAVTGGRVPTTGIGGLTLGSGSGWLERKLGFTVDNLLAAEVVLASGTVVQASASENPELFWGLKGGGGNFGIVTRFDYRLHAVGPLLYGGILGFPHQDMPRVLRQYRDFMDQAPDEVCGGVAVITAPPEPFVPESLRGRPALAIIVCYAGSPAEGEKAFQPLLRLDSPMPLVQPMPYLAIQRLVEESNPAGLRNYWKADMYPTLPDEAIDALASATAEPPSPFTSILVQPLGGAAARVPDDATAMGWRAARWSIHILGMWRDAADDEPNTSWVRRAWTAMSPWAQRGTYLNYLMDEGTDRIRESFGSHYDRMVALKDRYDPTNFFRMNQNIRPSGWQAARAVDSLTR
jgi:FAD/FMN-containing dehydrogenase